MGGQVRGMRRITGGALHHIEQMRRLGAAATSPVPGNRNIDPTRHLAITASAAVLIMALRFFLQRVYFPRVFSNIKPRMRRKLAENLFYTVFYVLSMTAGTFVLLIERLPLAFFFSNDPMWTLWVDLDKGVSMSQPFQVYYLVELGFYVGCLVFLILFDTRRSDFNQYVIHHLATLGLVVGSWIMGYTRFGAYILALHDISDIFLYGAKSVHYLGWAGVDTALFVAFAVLFYVTRLYMLPRIIYGIAVEPWKILSTRPDFNNWLSRWEIIIPHWASMLVALGTLQLLHCYWYCLVLKVIKRELSGKSLSEHGDVRSDDEDDGDDD